MKIKCELCGFKSDDENKFKIIGDDHVYCLDYAKEIRLGTVFTGKY